VSVSFGVVITAPAGREQNLSHVLRALAAQTVQPLAVVLVFDGTPAYAPSEPHTPTFPVEIPKHQPGSEQPRNVGVRELQRVEPECTHVAFVDSDVQLAPNALQAYTDAYDANPEPRVLVGPYDWLPAGMVGIHPDGPFFQLDDRRGSNGFADFDPDHIIRGDLTSLDVNDPETIGTVSFLMGAGGAQYGGNLVWPIDLFTGIGGFHPSMFHGRCEDGELGFRAIAHGIGVSFVREARGFHLHHSRNMEWILRANARDVPLFKTWHPWLDDYRTIATVKDGVRFTFPCPRCHEPIDTREYWTHYNGCNH
jgi:GT2 family glycosyltransferase